MDIKKGCCAALDSKEGIERKATMSDKSPQAVQLSQSSSFGVIRQIRCDYSDCALPAVLRLDVHFFCLDHLVSHCHTRLQACQQERSRLAGLPACRQASVNCFVDECASKVAAFLVARTELPNIDRARLLDVLLWATELDGKADRPRPIARFACAGPA
jgi:hypothetical protein